MNKEAFPNESRPLSNKQIKKGKSRGRNLHLDIKKIVVAPVSETTQLIRLWRSIEHDKSRPNFINKEQQVQRT
jgi:hypothetical protein